MTRHPILVVLAAALTASAAITGAALVLDPGLPGASPPSAPPAIASSPTIRPEPPAPADAGAPSTFIAFARDFRGFRAWERHSVEGAMIPVGAAAGPTFVYVNRRAPEGSQRWPVGTIMVKAIEAGAPSEWTVHAMVKRGLPYNGDGAVGWEYFELRLSDDGGDPSLAWRGPGPPSGHGYAAHGRDAGPDPIPLVCNDCHGAGWRNDGVLTPSVPLR